MLRPLAIGLPIILAVAGAFVVAMNVIPAGSPAFTWAIAAYAVLFPIALIVTIVAVIRAVRRAMRGGDPSLTRTGRRTMATVTAAQPTSATLRFGGGPPLRMVKVRLRPDHPEGGPEEFAAVRYVHLFDTSGGAGSRVPVYIDPAKPANRFISWAEISGGEAASGAPQMPDLSAMPKSLRRLIEAGLKQAGAPGAAAPSQDAAERPRGVVRPAEDEAPRVAPVREDGRARIEQLQPNPDGTYELDLFVSPRSRPSYRLTIALPVPPEHVGRMRRGQYLQARLDPAAPETIEIDWSRL